MVAFVTRSAFETMIDAIRRLQIRTAVANDDLTSVMFHSSAVFAAYLNFGLVMSGKLSTYEVVWIVCCTTIDLVLRLVEFPGRCADRYVRAIRASFYAIIAFGVVLLVSDHANILFKIHGWFAILVWCMYRT
jgi:hypothetical protein